MTEAVKKVQNLIAQIPVVMFSKSYCPHCVAAKDLLVQFGAKFTAIELDQVDGGAAMQDALFEISGQRTVPNIFIAQRHIGGNSQLQSIRGELIEMLGDAGARGPFNP